MNVKIESKMAELAVDSLSQEIRDAKDELAKMVERPYATACGEADAVQDRIDRLREELMRMETTWEGEVPEMDMEGIFRYFNRVEAGDGIRLEQIGYKLPSLSVGDIITVSTERRATYRVEPVGFTQLEVAV